MQFRHSYVEKLFSHLKDFQKKKLCLSRSVGQKNQIYTEAERKRTNFLKYSMLIF